MLLLWILLVTSAFAGVYIPNTPPVLMLGTDLGPSKSIFQPVRSAEFGQLLKPLWKDHMFLLYMAPELTSKDFNCKDCYPFARKMLPRTYYSQVQNPLRALEKMGKMKWPDKGNTSTLTKELEDEIPCRLRVIHAFNFTDRQLDQHDTFMYNISKHLSKCSHNLLHIYTSYNELERVLKRRRWRRAEFKLLPPGNQMRKIVSTVKSDERHGKEKHNLTILRHDEAVVGVEKIVLAIEMRFGTLYYYERSDLRVHDDEPLSLAMIDMANVLKGMTIMIRIEMGYLTITILPCDGNWAITRLTLNGNTSFFLPSMPYFGDKFSFCCNTLTAHTDNGSRLSLYSFHLDIVSNDSESGMDPNYRAKPCWSCDKYVTTHLLQCLFTLTILVGILALGVAMIWDIGRTNRMQKANQPDINVKTIS
ncbi:V-type proton ATPase subunit S1 [Drosophila tropicalis]|uniref:V-type proton ATPase subunit S1 n=1 Tax=Drosophila tropicalis TaxID=46794 RepID=UPI0035ABBD47